MLFLLLGCQLLSSAPEAPPPPEPAAPARPNVLLYVIDGGGADLMSLYGYGRPTTPELAALAEHAVVFEQARASSAWTKPSVAGFMTSLHHSVLGGFTANEDRIPAEVVPMAEHFQQGGWQTGVFTSNPFAGSMSGLERGADHFRDEGARPNATSSVELHAELLTWVDGLPEDAPWWAHVQTTDVHEPLAPVPPYAGRYATPEERAAFEGWRDALHGMKLERDTVLGKYKARLSAMGVDRRDFFRTQWDLYDESMSHNDATLSALIRDLQARGEWEDTILVVTADHGHPAGSFSRFGRGMVEPQPPEWEGALADSWRTWVPLVVSWPAGIEGGRRIDAPVSLLDLLPTLLELTGQAPPAVAQGRSLSPLLTGAGGWEDRALVLEQVQAWPETGEMVGHVEVIDGRWAASLEVMSDEARAAMTRAGSLTTSGGWRAARPHRADTPRLLLYDLDADPHCLSSVHADHPAEVARYTALLEETWAEHQALAARFSGAVAGEAGEAQLEALRVLGYVD